MGLDAVELILEIEEEFDIKITDEEAVCFLGTLGNLHDMLLERCGGLKREDCPTRSAFYRLRRAIVQAWGVDRNSLRPATPMLSLLRRWGRRCQWTRLQNELGLELPRLENWSGTGVVWGGMATFVGVFAVALFASGDLYLALAGAILGLLPGVILGYILGVLWVPTVGSWYRTLGQLARVLVVNNDREFRKTPEPSTVGDPIWDRLCDVLERELGVAKEDLRRETRFEDLGL